MAYFFLVDVLAVLFFLVAIGGVLILLLQWRDKRDLRLGAPPGTIASAIAIAGQSELSYILEGMDTMEEMETLLSDLTFRIDSVSIFFICLSLFFLCVCWIYKRVGGYRWKKAVRLGIWSYLTIETSVWFLWKYRKKFFSSILYPFACKETQNDNHWLISHYSWQPSDSYKT